VALFLLRKVVSVAAYPCGGNRWPKPFSPARGNCTRSPQNFPGRKHPLKPEKSPELGPNRALESLAHYYPGSMAPWEKRSESILPLHTQPDGDGKAAAPMGRMGAFHATDAQGNVILAGESIETMHFSPAQYVAPSPSRPTVRSSATSCPPIYPRLADGDP